MSAAAAVQRGGILTSGPEKDYNHVSDEEYKRLRELANQAFQKKNKLSQQSQEAYKSGDGSRARELSEQAKKQLEVADSYNFQAAKYVFIQNNADSDRDELDLHGLFIKEAEYVLKTRIVGGLQRSESVLKVIVGKGLHSKDGVAKLKPAVTTLCSEAGISWKIDSRNTGVLLINLKNARAPESWYKIPPLEQVVGAPANAYIPQQQPQYQAPINNYNQQYNNYNQQQGNNNNNNNSVVKLLLNVFCLCVKKFT